MTDPGIPDHIYTDPYTQFLGATLEAVEPGYGRAALTVTQKMLNFHRITHGGVVFGLGDIAFAAASNAAGMKSVAQKVTVSYLRPTGAGDRLVAEAREVGADGALVQYEITVSEQKSGQLVASFQAQAYRRAS